MKSELRRAIAKISAKRDGGNPVFGTGFLVTEQHLLTAFHVVGDRAAAKLGRSPSLFSELTVSMRDAGLPDLRARVVEDCFDVVDDWALIELASPVSDVRPISLGVITQEEIDRLAESGRILTFQSWGFPSVARIAEGGLTLDGRVQTRDGNYQGAWALQLYSDNAAAGLADQLNGLSGAPCLVDGVAVGIMRSNLVVADNQPPHIFGGILYACPVECLTLQNRCEPYLPPLDPIRGLPGILPRELPNAPFRYLHWYEAKHAELFFGRSLKIKEVYTKLSAGDGPKLILLYGASGVGKSSLIEAGLIPRLDRDFDVFIERVSRNGELPVVLDNLLGPAGRQRNISEKPTIIILDQLETVFTDAHRNGNEELSSACERIGSAIRANNDGRLRIVLSFRSEWLANIRSRVLDANIAYAETHLERLSEFDIEEVVRGLQSTPRLRARYGIEVDEELPENIARSLLIDPKSPIAPMLSIVLTRLWENAIKQPPAGRRLSAAFYDQQLRERLNLRTFLEEQIAEATRMRSVDEASGLVTDVLYRHTTEQGTAKELSRGEIRDLYAHLDGPTRSPGEYIESLIDDLQSQSLIYREGPQAEGADHTTRLSHDTLAPWVRARYDQSVRPGQRAARILRNRAEDLDNQDSVGVFLDAAELALVEDGFRGTRKQTPSEKLLVLNSTIKRNRSVVKRRAVFAITAITTIAFAILVFVLLAAQRETEVQYREAEAANLARVAERLADNGFSLDAAAKATAAMDRLQQGGTVLNQAPAVRSLAIVNLKSRSVILPTVLPLPGILFFPTSNVVAGRPTRKHIRPVYKNNEIRLFDADTGNDVFSLKVNSSIIAVAGDAYRDELYILERSGVVSRFSVGRRSQLGKFDLVGSVAQLERFDFVPSRGVLLSLWKDRAVIFDPMSNEQTQLSSSRLTKFLDGLIFAVDYSALGKLQAASLGEDVTAKGIQYLTKIDQIAADNFCSFAATGGFDGVLRLWDLHGNLPPTQSFAANVSDRILMLKLSPRCDSILIKKESGVSLFDVARKQETAFWKDEPLSNKFGFDDTGNVIFFSDREKTRMVHIRADTSLGGHRWRSVAEFRPVQDEVLMRIVTRRNDDRDATPIGGAKSSDQKEAETKLNVVAADAATGAIKCNDVAEIPADLPFVKRGGGKGAPSRIVLMGGKGCQHYLVGINGTLFDVSRSKEGAGSQFDWIKVADLPEEYDVWPTTWSSVSMSLRDTVVLVPTGSGWRLLKRTKLNDKVSWQEQSFPNIVPEGTSLGGSAADAPAFNYMSLEGDNESVVLGDSKKVFLAKIGTSEVAWQRAASPGCSSVVIRNRDGDIFVQEYGKEPCASAIYKIDLKKRNAEHFAKGFLLRGYAGGPLFLVEEDQSVKVVDSRGIERCRMALPKERIVYDEVQPGQLDWINSSTVTEGSFLFSPHQNANLHRWHFATLTDSYVVGGYNSSVRIWSARDCTLISDASLEKKSGNEVISDIIGIGKGDLFAVATQNGGSISLWKATAGAEIASVGSRGTVRRLLGYEGVLYGTVGIREAVDIVRVDNFTIRTLLKTASKSYTELKTWVDNLSSKEASADQE